MFVSEVADQVMGKPLTIALLTTCLFATSTLAGGQKLVMRVSPAVALAPALLTVRTTVEADADNRALEITVDSATFQRTSQIQLDGANAPRFNVFELRDVPTGLYEVRAVLLGTRGPRASTLQLVKVQPSAGSSR